MKKLITLIQYTLNRKRRPKLTFSVFVKIVLLALLE